MTRRDYILIAGALRQAFEQINEPRRTGGGMAMKSYDAFDIVVDRLADALARENPRFDRVRFLRAAGRET